MATKVKDHAAEALAELDALLPNRTVTIGGESITVRAFTLRDALQLQSASATLIEALSAAMLSDSPVTFEDVDVIFSAHSDVTEHLISHATGKPVSWVAAQKPTDGWYLLDLLWVVNKDFFIDAARRKISVRQAIKNQQVATPDTLKSSQPSSAQDTQQKGLATTPSSS